MGVAGDHLRAHRPSGEDCGSEAAARAGRCADGQPVSASVKLNELLAQHRRLKSWKIRIGSYAARPFLFFCVYLES